MLEYRYFCSVHAVYAINNEGILLTSFIERFSLFSIYAMYQTVCTAACKYIGHPRNKFKYSFLMNIWCIVILYRIVTTQYLDTRYSVSGLANPPK